MKATFFSTVMVLVLISSASYAAGSVAIIRSNFDANRDGWRASGDSTSTIPTWVATGGNPDGHIRVNDQRLGGVWFYDAPAKFLGNKAGAYGLTLDFDLRQTGSGSQFDIADVALEGAGLILTIDAGPNPLPLGNWVTYSVLLSETAGWQSVTDHRTLSGTPATKSDLLAVLGSLERMRIRGEFISGSDIGRLDNVTLSVPEPGSFVTMFVAGMIVSLARRGATGGLAASAMGMRVFTRPIVNESVTSTTPAMLTS